MVSQPVSTLAAPGTRTSRAWLPLVLFCAGHFLVDLYSGALGTLQPLLVERFGMTFTQAGLLGGMLVFSSSVMQPLYGYLSDRFHSRCSRRWRPAWRAYSSPRWAWRPSYGWLLRDGGAGRRGRRLVPSAGAVARGRGRPPTAAAPWRSSSAPGRWAWPAGRRYFSALAAAGGPERGCTGARFPACCDAAAAGRSCRRRSSALTPGVTASTGRPCAPSGSR